MPGPQLTKPPFPFSLPHLPQAAKDLSLLGPPNEDGERKRARIEAMLGPKLKSAVQVGGRAAVNLFSVVLRADSTCVPTVRKTTACGAPCTWHHDLQSFARK